MSFAPKSRLSQERQAQFAACNAFALRGVSQAFNKKRPQSRVSLKVFLVKVKNIPEIGAEQFRIFHSRYRKL